MWQTILHLPQKVPPALVSLAAELQLTFLICHHLSHFLKKISVDHVPVCWGQLSVKAEPGSFVFRLAAAADTKQTLP